MCVSDSECLVLLRVCAYVIKQIMCTEVFNSAKVAPLWAVWPSYNNVSLSYVNNWFSPIVFVKFAEENPEKKPNTFFSSLHHISQIFSSPLSSLSLFLEHAPILQTLNRSVSFFPCKKKHFSSLICLCVVFFFSCLEKFAVPEEGGGGVANGPGDWPHQSCAALALQPTCTHFACSHYLKTVICY